MSGLDLLLNYSSDSSDTDTVPNKIPKLQTESKIRLPLPSVFLKENKNNIIDEEHIDDPCKHKGKIRRYPHERGNWSTYVYAPYTPNDEFLNLINDLQNECGALDTFHIVEDFHVSVSKTLILRFHWINTFISSLRENLQQVDKFIIEFNNIKIYTNEDDSRTFIGLKINTGNKHLYNIVQQVDKAAEEFGLPLFYDNPSFHISVLWCLGNKKKELNKLLAKLQHILQEALENTDEKNHFHQLYVEHLTCKTGNKIFDIKLK